MNKSPIEFTEKYIKVCNKEYKEKLETLYPKAYSENPEAFPLANLFNIDAYIIKGNEKFLKMSYFLFLFQGKGKMEYLGEIDNKEYSRLKNFKDIDDFVVDIINNITGNHKRDYYYTTGALESYLNIDHVTPEEFIRIQRENISNHILEQLRKDGDRFINHIDKEASYYAKDAFRYAYSELDFSPVIKAVNDQDFEYALNESIACYDHSLYLAAVSTAGTALENLIIRILEYEGKSIDDSGVTELGELSGRLRSAGLINRRERRRIMLAASFRNLASHANKGRVTRQDAKLVYQEIFNLADKFFDV